MTSRFPTASLFSAALLALLTGCKSLPRYYNVGVDAISAPAATAVASGTSYLLIAKDPSSYRDPALHSIAVACVKVALQGHGLYEVPANTKPDLIIEMDYGRGNSIALGPNGTTQEIYLSLSARSNPGDGATARGQEVWNVRSSIIDENSKAIVIMPVLAAVAADHAGNETRVKQEFKISDKDASVAYINSSLGFDRLARTGSTGNGTGP